MIALTYDDLSLQVGGVAVLECFRLDLTGPGVVAILGPSGVGKSSLLQATQRLIEHGRDGWKRSGDVRFNGKSLFAPHIKTHELARWMGFLQQKPRMLGGSVRANVEFAIRHNTRLPRATVRQKAEAALELVGLTTELDCLDREAWQLSGGQAQRLAIARAIALDPSVLLMDEPSSALDPLTSLRVESIIRDLAATRLVIMVTHEVALAERLAHRVAFLRRSEAGARLVEYGDVATMLNAPQDPWVREFVWTGLGRAQDGTPVAVQRQPEMLPEPSSGRPLFPGAGLLQRVYLFVCDGNRSRSPMAQAICRHEVGRLLQMIPEQLESSQFRTLSAGLSATLASPMPTLAQEALNTLGVPQHPHLSRPVNEALVSQADTIYCMTGTQCHELVQRFPSASAKTQRLDPMGDIDEPSGGDVASFAAVAKRIQALVKWRLASQMQCPLPVT